VSVRVDTDNSVSVGNPVGADHAGDALDVNESVCCEETYPGFDSSPIDLRVVHDFVVSDVRDVSAAISAGNHQKEKLKCVQFCDPAQLEVGKCRDDAR